MEQTRSRPILSRRAFLRLMAAAGVTAAGGYAFYTSAPWLDYDQQRRQTWRILEKDAAVSAQMRELVRYATLGANGHNAQPWKFAIKENALEIHPDYARRLSIVDPKDRELWISLGCALENLLLAAHAIGYATKVTYPGPEDFIHIRLSQDTPRSTAQFEAIPLRQNTRSEYDGQPVKTAALDQVQALPMEPGVVLRPITNQSGMETVLDYVSRGNVIQYADKAFVDELIYWLRFNKREALDSLDGLFTRCTGNPEVPRWLGKRFVAATKPRQQADSDARKVRSSSGALVFASESDDKAAWVRTGQVYERVALKMTSLDIKSAFLNQPIEVASIRSQFQSAMSLGASLPQLLIRFGYADAMPHSLRRPAERVLMQP
jgi:hypothetical protein